MFIINGLVFTKKRTPDGKTVHGIECRSERGGVVNHFVRKASDSEEAETAAHTELLEWFRSHTRPDPVRAQVVGSEDSKKRPYRPAGFLRRLTNDELTASHYAQAVRVD